MGEGPDLIKSGKKRSALSWSRLWRETSRNVQKKVSEPNKRVKGGQERNHGETGEKKEIRRKENFPQESSTKDMVA